ncbi:MAG: glycosyltransferase [candidate division Zixibacteria bacterium]|nr:glycosyltransferase [candidate division Zixibacteria bacterium]
MSKRLKLILSYIFYYLGLFELEELLFGKRKAKIVSFHRVLDQKEKSQCYDPSLVVTRDNFKSLIGYLAKRYNILTLNQLAGDINNRQPFSNRTCVLTFDDGYRDNYLNAYPALKSFNLSATIFITVGYVGKDKAFWQESFFRLMSILYERREELNKDAEERVSCLEIKKEVLELFKHGDNRFWEITKLMVERMKGLPQSEIQLIMDELLEISGEERHKLERGCEFSSWKEIQEMSENGIDFGSHTLSHTILTVEPKENVKIEVERSKEIIEEKLGRKINHFAYPNGDFNPTVVEIVKNSGFVSGSSVGDGCTDINSNIYELNRNYIHDEKITNLKEKFSAPLFEFETSFIIGAVRRWLKAHIFLKSPPKSLVSAKPQHLKRKIKVLYLIGNLGHGKAGTEGHLITILGALDRERFEPYLCCLNRGSWLDINPPDCPTIILDFDGFHNPNTISKILRLRKFIQEQRIDLLHAFFVDANVIGILASRLAGVKLIISCRRNLGYSYLARELVMLKLVSPFVTRFLANSYAVKSNISHKESIDPNRIDLIYNGVDLNPFKKIDQNLRQETKQKLNLAADSSVVGLVANLRPIKNIELFIESAALVLKKRRNVYFLLVGEGPSINDLRNLSKRLRIEDKVLFIGHCTDIIPYLAIFDVGVLSSDSEGFSNSILEYMAAGLPVVATEVGGNTEAIVHNQTGFLVKPKDKEEMSKTLLTLLNDDKLRSKMGAEGRKRIEERFTLNHMMSQLGKYYYSLMANR